MKKFQTLKGRKIFREVLRKGRRFYGKEIQLIVYNINGWEGFFNKNTAPVENCLRIGIQIDRKYGNAVKRNLAKRRIRAVCSEILPGIERNFFVIVRPLERFKELKYDETKKLIMLLFKKAGMCRSARL